MTERFLWATSFLLAAVAACVVAFARRSTLTRPGLARRLDRLFWIVAAALLLGAGVIVCTHLPARLIELARSLGHRWNWHAHRGLVWAIVKGAAVFAAVAGLGTLWLLARAAPLTRLAFVAAALLAGMAAVPVVSFRARMMLLSRCGPFTLRDLLGVAGLIAVALAAARAIGWSPRGRGRRALVGLGACLLIPLAALVTSGASTAAAAHRIARAGNLPTGLGRPFAEGVGGGYTDVGPRGDYFAGPDLEGRPAFQRRDVRIDFDWGTTAKPGGSNSPSFAALGHDTFSVRWQGAVVPRFSEPYTFEVDADEGVRLWVRDGDGQAWQPIVDGWSAGGVRRSSARPMTAGHAVAFKLEYRQTGGPAHVRLLWSSPNTPREVIEPLSMSGVNVGGVGGFVEPLWADAMKGARYRWTVPDGDTPVPLDHHGWPLRDAEDVVFEGVTQTRGTYRLRFEGRATLSTFPDLTFLVGGHPVGETLASGVGYDPRTNVTSADLRLDEDQSILIFKFHDTQRAPGAALGSGVRAVSLMRPVAPGADRPIEPGTLFVDGAKHFFADGFTTIRWDLNFDKGGVWKDRVVPSSAAAKHDGEPVPWEYAVMLANETGRDMLISTPVNATDDYLRDLARLIRFGSRDDGSPYTRAERSPRFPPLNSNLRLYIERSNEIWNWAFSQSQENLRQVREAVAAGTPEALIVNYDHRVATDNGGDLWLRWHALQTKRISDIFAGVFGADAINRRVRVIYEYQYDDEQGTASEGLTFLDDYFNNANGDHVPDPKPVAAYLWGAGGATYYGSGNPTGKQSAVQVADGGFEKPSGASPWTFHGTAGTYRGSALTDALRLHAAGPMTAANGVAIGWRFTVGPRPIAVYEVGRIVGAGLSHNHGLRIIRLADRAVLCYGDLETESTPKPTGTWDWVRLGHPVLLAANTAYAIASEESPDGDRVNLRPTVQAAGALHVDGGLRATGGSWDDVASWRLDGSPGIDLGPASFRYSIAPAASPMGPPPRPIEGRQAAFITGNGAIETTIDFGAGGMYAVQYAAAGKDDAVDPLDFFLDDQRVTSFAEGRDPRVSPEPFQGGRWAYDARDLLSYTTVARPLSGRHRLRIVGRGPAQDAVFLDDVTVVSVGAIFVGGMPAAGQATGQSGVDDWRRQMNAQARYARAFGLHDVAYEGGWSVGGDFGQTVVQSAAKYLDPRAKAVNDRAQETIAAAGYDLNVWGTYDLWPTSFEALDRSLTYPLTTSIREGNNRLWSKVGPARSIPGTFSAKDAAWGWPSADSPGSLGKAGALAFYDLFATGTGRYDITVETAGSGSVRLLIDGGLSFEGQGPAGAAMRAEGVHLAAGRHGLVVQSLGGAMQVASVAVQRASAH